MLRCNCTLMPFFSLHFLALHSLRRSLVDHSPPLPPFFSPTTTLLVLLPTYETRPSCYTTFDMTTTQKGEEFFKKGNRRNDMT